MEKLENCTFWVIIDSETGLPIEGKIGSYIKKVEDIGRIFFKYYEAERYLEDVKKEYNDIKGYSWEKVDKFVIRVLETKWLENYAFML